jgi:putative component of toxin-antitoxin plasmid stabilization module
MCRHGNLHPVALTIEALRVRLGDGVIYYSPTYKFGGMLACAGMTTATVGRSARTIRSYCTV